MMIKTARADALYARAHKREILSRHHIDGLYMVKTDRTKKFVVSWCASAQTAQYPMTEDAVSNQSGNAGTYQFSDTHPTYLQGNTMINLARTDLNPSPRSALTRIVTTGLAILALAACASTPQPPLQEIQAADLAISRAEQASVAEYASLELNQAREKVAAARVAVQEEEMTVARQLAEESRASAELASARAEMLRAKEVNDDMQTSIDTLKQEMLRNSGTRQ